MPSPSRKGSGKGRTVAFLGVMLSLSLVMAYIETFITLPFTIPGVKIGLANIITLMLLYQSGWKQALTVGVLRVILSGFLFGSLFGILFGMTGMVLSLIVMSVTKGCGRFSVRGVSMAGGVSHNIGQIIAALVVTETPGVIWYLPALLVAGLVMGGINGVLAGLVLPYLRKME